MSARGAQSMPRKTGPGKAGGQPVMPKIEERPRRVGGGFAGGEHSASPERKLAPTKMESPLRSGFVPAVMRDVVARSPERADGEDAEQGLRQKSEREYLRRVFIRMWAAGDREKVATVKAVRGLKVGVGQVTTYLKRLGYTPSPGEVEKLIWEVDDDGDGSVSWKEFEATHVRLVNHNFENRAGVYEPRGFFNLIEFSLLDKDGSGDVDCAEVVAVFYRRYGKDGAMKKVDMLVDQQALNKTIRFTDFLQADNKLRLDARRVMGKIRQRSAEPPTRSEVVQRPV